MASTHPLPNDAAAALEYGESLKIHGAVSDDPFYSAPTGSANDPPGTLLKVELQTDTSKYMLPPATTLSRFLYQSENLQGSPVPASAFVLWPLLPRVLKDGKYPIVAWAHGTAGVHKNCAPSNTKNLWQHWLAPFPLALQGYVVVAPDYAGLGVAKTADGQDIIHQYTANPAQANDVVFAVEAAQKAFSNLSSEFVVIGHSQGGGAAWAVAERQAQKPVKGYLGAVSVSPVTNILELPVESNDLVPVMSVYAAHTFQHIYPDFQIKDFFTDLGWERHQLECQVGGFTPVLAEIMTGFQALKDGWSSNAHLQKFVDWTAAGGRKIGGPLLVIQGDADEAMNVNTTSSAFHKTKKAFPDSQLQYYTLPGATHLPTMYATQRLWLEWIENRFRGVHVKAECEPFRAYEPPRPLDSYQMEPNWTIKVDERSFRLPY